MCRKKYGYLSTLLLLLLILQGLGTAPLSQVFAQEENVSVTALAWSSDGTQLALGTGQGQITIVEAGSQKVLSTWQAHDYEVLNLAWSYDGTRLISGSVEARVWSTTGRLIHTFEIESGSGVSEVDWFPADDYVLVSDTQIDLNIRVYETTQWTLVYSSEWGFIYSSTFSPNGQLWTISNSNPASIDLRNPQTFQRIRYLGTNPDQLIGVSSEGKHIQQLAWNPVGTYLVSGATRHVTLWDTAQSGSASEVFNRVGTDVETQKRGLLWIMAVWFSSDGATFGSLAGDGTYRTWETATGELVQDTQLGYTVTAANVSPDRQQLALGKTDGTFQIIDLVRDEE